MCVELRYSPLVENSEVFVFEYNNKFDGIWACASLLHLRKEEIKKNFVNVVLR